MGVRVWECMLVSASVQLLYIKGILKKVTQMLTPTYTPPPNTHVYCLAGHTVILEYI